MLWCMQQCLLKIVISVVVVSGTESSLRPIASSVDQGLDTTGSTSAHRPPPPPRQVRSPAGEALPGAPPVPRRGSHGTRHVASPFWGGSRTFAAKVTPGGTTVIGPGAGASRTSRASPHPAPHPQPLAAQGPHSPGPGARGAAEGPRGSGGAGTPGAARERQPPQGSAQHRAHPARLRDAERWRRASPRGGRTAAPPRTALAGRAQARPLAGAAARVSPGARPAAHPEPQPGWAGPRGRGADSVRAGRVVSWRGQGVRGRARPGASPAALPPRPASHPGYKRAV
ncbi:uncharacterized protein LOC110389737 [Numida meleagris]|uniref:uncharacterized protein LOC110389737 n=1 Tax=Numida meleagris TaxID=8996 RepID=UPI000B3E0885|nr:uncharacterized protein LOC110389737 [Numida meleagris]